MKKYVLGFAVAAVVSAIGVFFYALARVAGEEDYEDDEAYEDDSYREGPDEEEGELGP